MDIARIASSVASLAPLPQVQAWAEDLLADEKEPELREILEAIVEAARANQSDAYLLQQDFKEIAEEYNYTPVEELRVASV